MQIYNHFTTFSNSTSSQFSLYPVGYIARVEAELSQMKLVIETKSINAVMLNIDDAEKLVKMGLDSSYFGPNKLVMTTSTINDLTLPKYYLEREAEVVTKFCPKFHIPRDRPVYLSQNKRERLWNISTQVEETIELLELLDGTSTKLIPLLKGVDREELLSCYFPLRNKGFRAFSYYVAQYFGNGRGNLSTNLINDVREISTLPDLFYIMLIGLQSKNIIRKLPPVVRAYAGSRFTRENCWKKVKIKNAGQTNLFQFYNSGGK